MASEGHCSDVAFHISVAGKKRKISGFLGPGASTSLFNLSSSIKKPGKYEIGIVAEGTEGGCNSGDLGSWAGTLRTITNPRGEFASKFEVVAERAGGGELGGFDLDSAGPGDVLGYTGADWDPEGESVDIFWDKQRVATSSCCPANLVLDEDGNFTGTYTLEGWPQRNQEGCSGKLTARQGAISRSKTIRGVVAQQLVWAEGGVTVRPFNAQLSVGDPLCEDELLTPDGGNLVDVGADGSYVPVDLPQDGPLLGLGPRAMNVPRRIEWFGHMILNEKHYICMNLSGSGSVKFTHTGARLQTSPSDSPCSENDFTTSSDVPGLDMGQFDTRNESGVQDVASTTGDVTLQGAGRSKDNLTIDGSLTLDGGVLFVDGNLIVRGGIRGRGNIFVTGATLVEGSFDLEGVPVGDDVGGGTIPLVSQGVVNLLGSP